MPVRNQQSLLTLDTQLPEVFCYRQWYFAFCENETPIPRWQQWFVRNDPKHLQHVYAFTQVGDYVLFVEPSRTRIDFVIKYPNEEFPKMCAMEMAYELYQAGHVVIRHNYRPSISGVKSIFNWIPTCVTVVKCATGFASFAWTPLDLLKDLLRSGGEVINEGKFNGRNYIEAKTEGPKCGANPPTEGTSGAGTKAAGANRGAE